MRMHQVFYAGTFAMTTSQQVMWRYEQWLLQIEVQLANIPAHRQVSSPNWCSRIFFAYASNYTRTAASTIEIVSGILLCLLGFAWHSSHHDTCTHCTTLQVKCFDAAICIRHIRGIGVYLHRLKQAPGHEVRTRSIHDSVVWHGDLQALRVCQTTGLLHCAVIVTRVSLPLRAISARTWSKQAAA